MAHFGTDEKGRGKRHHFQANKYLTQFERDMFQYLRSGLMWDRFSELKYQAYKEKPSDLRALVGDGVPIPEFDENYVKQLENDIDVLAGESLNAPPKRTLELFKEELSKLESKLEKKMPKPEKDEIKHYIALYKRFIWAIESNLAGKELPNKPPEVSEEYDQDFLIYEDKKAKEYAALFTPEQLEAKEKDPEKHKLMVKRRWSARHMTIAKQNDKGNLLVRIRKPYQYKNDKIKEIKFHLVKTDKGFDIRYEFPGGERHVGAVFWHDGVLKPDDMLVDVFRAAYPKSSGNLGKHNQKFKSEHEVVNLLARMMLNPMKEAGSHESPEEKCDPEARFEFHFRNILNSVARKAGAYCGGVID